MLIRSWVKRSGIGLASALMLLLAVAWMLPRPWWSKEAGPSPSPFSMVRSWGTGFFVTPDGWVVTNEHVVSGCRRVSVGSGILSGLVADKVLYPRDAQLDLAAVHVAVKAPAFLRFARTPWPSPLSDPHTLPSEIKADLHSILSESGQSVFIVGFPGYDHAASPVRLEGKLLEIASSNDRHHWFQRIKAQVRPGSSGSPVINGEGEVVGIVFKASVDLPGKSSAALEEKALAILHSSAEEALIVPAALAHGFIGAVDSSPSREEGTGPAEPSAAVVRVFCFR